MGYIKHDAVVAVVDDTQSDVVESWRSGLEDEFIRGLVLGPVKGVNGYDTWVFAPDGSKEGWDSSDTADAFRDQFLHLVTNNLRWSDVVHVSFGGDQGYAIVEYDSDQKQPPTVGEYLRAKHES